MKRRFDWDPIKAHENLLKHDVDFLHARLVFDDPDVYFVDDDRIDYGERRRVAIGRVGRRVLFVVFTDRENARRLISARKADKDERELYYHDRGR